MIFDKNLALQVYNSIDSVAGSNSFFQGLSGVFGFPYTLLADGAVLFTHYGSMINDIRARYARIPITKDELIAVINSIGQELLFDILADKILGQVPLVGIYFNAICAKTMTWRLGLLFANLSRDNVIINEESALRVIKDVRLVTPQYDVFRFKRPNYTDAEPLLIYKP